MKKTENQLSMQRLRTKWVIILGMCTILFSVIAFTGCKSTSKRNSNNDSQTLGEYLGSERPQE